MPTVYDYDDETNVPEIEKDSPDDRNYVLDNLLSDIF